MKRSAFLILPLLLAACTGTEDVTSTLRLAVLTDGGALLRAVTPAADTSATPVTDNGSAALTGGVSLDTLPSGRRLALTGAGGIESRNTDLADPQPFAAPGFTPVCLIQTAASAARDRLLTLSACPNGAQQLALYRENGTLVWTATLPPYLPPSPGSDTPPIRLAVLGDVGLVARPRVGGGSEVMRAAQTSAGAARAEVSTPLPTPALRDLAPYAAGVVAATDSGVQRLKASGEPDAATTIAAFGQGRFDRLWSGAAGTRPLLAAWRSDQPSGSAQPLLVWDGAATGAATVESLRDLRDLTLAPDGFLYALTGTALTRYDTVYGLGQGNWRPRTLLTGLNDARALTWLVP